jgi:hypothetical protein
MVRPFPWSRGGFSLPGKVNPDRGLADAAKVGFAAHWAVVFWFPHTSVVATAD